MFRVPNSSFSTSYFPPFFFEFGFLLTALKILPLNPPSGTTPSPFLWAALPPENCAVQCVMVHTVTLVEIGPCRKYMMATLDCVVFFWESLHFGLSRRSPLFCMTAQSHCSMASYLTFPPGSLGVHLFLCHLVVSWVFSSERSHSRIFLFLRFPPPACFLKVLTSIFDILSLEDLIF